MLSISARGLPLGRTPSSIHVQCTRTGTIRQRRLSIRTAVHAPHDHSQKRSVWGNFLGSISVRFWTPVILLPTLGKTAHNFLDRSQSLRSINYGRSILRPKSPSLFWAFRAWVYGPLAHQKPAATKCHIGWWQGKKDPITRLEKGNCNKKTVQAGSDCNWIMIYRRRNL